MFDVVVVSHGHLSEELLSTARMLVGSEVDGVACVTYEAGESFDGLVDRIADAVASSVAAGGQGGPASGGALVLCDLLGGSPFIASAQVSRDQTDDRPVEVVTGVNLGMLLEVLTGRGDMSLAEGRACALESGTKAICDLTERLAG